MLKLHTVIFRVQFFRLLSSNIRVRFAPSPTGTLHIGGLRTALYNYLFAHKHQGKFILRIEDTDTDRCVPGAVENILEGLSWVGIFPDESPVEGGQCGPYTQSERNETYQHKILDLLEDGSAYHCFCSEERLTKLREECRREKKIAKYDGKCRSLNTTEVKDKLLKHEKFVVRLKLSSRFTQFKDMIYGDVSKNVADQDGDPVLMKSDGNPTYHFANVVDDHLMEISHVLRGNEWLVSAPKHIEIYEAFSWDPPKFGHLPLMLKADGRKFSKRDNDTQVNFYKNKGICPEALINFLTSSSSGFIDHNSTTPYSLCELTEKFDLQKIKTNSCKLDFKKLSQLNRSWIQRKLSTDQGQKELLNCGSKLINEKFPNFAASNKNDGYILKVLTLIQDRINTVHEAVDDEYNFFWNPAPYSEFFKVNEGVELYLDVAERSLESLHTDDFRKSAVNEILKSASNENGLDLKKMMKVLRFSYSSCKSGLPVGEVLEVFGKSNAIKCLKMARKSIQLKHNSPG